MLVSHLCKKKKIEKRECITLACKWKMYLTTNNSSAALGRLERTSGVHQAQSAAQIKAS